MQKKTKKVRFKRLSIRIPESLYKEVQEISNRTGESMSQVFSDHLDVEHLKEWVFRRRDYLDMIEGTPKLDFPDQK